MIQKLYLENYKAFKTANIPLKPLTVFLGANSVGKSSIIQLLLLLQQTGKESLKSYKSALKLYGGYVNLGDSINLIRNRDQKKEICISFDIKNKSLKRALKEDLLDVFLDNLTSIPKYIPIKAFSKIRNKEIDSVDDLKEYIDVFVELLNKRNAKEEFIDEIRWFLQKRSFLNLGIVNKNNKIDYIKSYTFLKSLSKLITNEIFTIKINLSYQENKFLISELVLSHKEKKILAVSNKESFSVSSDLIFIKASVEEELKGLFNPNNTIFSSFSFADDDELKSPLTVLISKILNISLSKLKEEFSDERINYVSPLRAHPKRYYMLDKDKINITLDTLDGDAIADVLKDNSKIKEKVNNWLKKFDLEVDVEEFKEVIHHLKIKQNNLNLDITDVGFGISQILPVIIQGFLSSKDSTTIIEQPEIHLHPKIQADLADLFIDIIKTSSKEKKIIIETHSEYILKRIRRRISEGKISPKDVSICLFHPAKDEEPAFIENINIEAKGYFEWPIDFYGGELLKDITEFLKNQ